MCYTRTRGGDQGGLLPPVGELCTVSCVSGDVNSVDLPQIFFCKSSESLLRIFGPENFTCVADVCSHVPNMDNSVVSDCGDTQLRTGDTCTARCASGYVLGVGDTEQIFSCQPDGVVSGTQPVCEPLPCLAPKVASEHGADVCIDSADERSCVVSSASGYSIVGDLAVWTSTTNGSWTDGGLPTCEPQGCADLSLGSSVVSDCDGTLYSHTCTVSCASGYVASDMGITLFFNVSLLQVYQMGLFAGASCWFSVVRNLTVWRVSRTLATGLVPVIIAEQKAPMVRLKLTGVCVERQHLHPKSTILLLHAHQSEVLPPSHQQVPVTIATVSLCRKNAPPLAQRVTRLSRVQQH